MNGLEYEDEKENKRVRYGTAEAFPRKIQIGYKQFRDISYAYNRAQSRFMIDKGVISSAICTGVAFLCDSGDRVAAMSVCGGNLIVVQIFRLVQREP